MDVNLILQEQTRIPELRTVDKTPQILVNCLHICVQSCPHRAALHSIQIKFTAAHEALPWQHATDCLRAESHRVNGIKSLPAGCRLMLHLVAPLFLAVVRGGESEGVNPAAYRIHHVVGINQVAVLRFKVKFIKLARCDFIVARRLRLPPHLVCHVKSAGIRELVGNFGIGIVGAPAQRRFGVNEPPVWRRIGQAVKELNAARFFVFVDDFKLAVFIV